ncbi:hypothetical protein JOC58_000037 [Paenibacillus hunanensis]|uniref:Uncharacterized protein n=1 Tax=Paenibacillus hunanensis TaxID=539262 RepID=A0ABU1IVB2_9BACL|nr:hypothetical protein [Paenibacillus hunanensis]
MMDRELDTKQNDHIGDRGMLDIAKHASFI